MSDAHGSPPFPGPARQFGYVVTDFDRALESWIAAGVGPWFVLRGLAQQCSYRGAPTQVSLSIGLTNIGDMQIEVIAQDDSTPSVYREFLESGREGFHQLAWWVEDFDAALAAAADRGWPVVWSGGEGGGVRFAYVEPSDGAAAIYEIIELNEAITGLDGMIRDAVDGWDGSDPVRCLL